MSDTEEKIKRLKEEIETNNKRIRELEKLRKLGQVV
jgi:peptidoglycan hydrolase CwlO-like protein